MCLAKVSHRKEENMYCISISHKTTPVHIRELFAFSKQEQIEFGQQIMINEEITGCVIVSTCNRSDIYFTGEKKAINIMEKVVCQYKNISLVQNLKYFNVFCDESAIRHLFRVAIGLDSMVIGEDEILRQVKESYQLALENRFTNQELNIAFQGAVSSSKMIKTNTNISNIPVSIGTLTANCVVDFLKQNNCCNVLIVGITGQMGNIVAKNLSVKGDLNIIGISRKHNAANDLFENYSNIEVVAYKDRYQFLERSDVIVSMTTSPHYTFTYNEVSEALKDNKKNKLFIDLAVPGDIDKEIAISKHCEILDIDYFEKASKKNNLTKLKELDKVELILDSRIDETLKDIYVQKFQPIMDAVNNTAQTKGFNYLFYHLKDSLNSEQLKAVLQALRNIEKGDK